MNTECVKTIRGFFPLIGAKFICSSYQYPRRGSGRVLQEMLKALPVPGGVKW